MSDERRAAKGESEPPPGLEEATSVEQLKAEIAMLRERVVELMSRHPPNSARSGDPGPGSAPAEDSSDKMSAERLLRESQHHLLLALVENSLSIIFIKNVEGRYLLCNRRLERFCGLSQERILGNTDADLFPPAIAADFRATDVAVMAGGRAVSFEETVPAPEKSGQEMIFRTIKFPLYNPGGKLIGLCGINTEITALKRSEAERAALQEQVIEAQRIALQELSTPLIPIADGVLVMPIIGAIDAGRAQQILEALLAGISAHRAHTAILDVTGVRVVDQQVASALLGAARAARLLGARVLLTGIRPEVAQMLVGLSADLTGVVTLGTLQSGIAHALGR